MSEKKDTQNETREAVVGEQQKVKEPVDVGEVEDMELYKASDPNLKQKTAKAFTGSIQTEDARKLANELKVKFRSTKWVTNYAVAIHDKDVYTQMDADKAKAIRDNPDAPKPDYPIPEVGAAKPVHVHWAIRIGSTKGQALGKVAELLEQPQNQIIICRTKKGDKVSGFYRMCQYFTHSSAKQKALGKTIYPDSVVETDPATDWRKEIVSSKAKADLHDEIMTLCMDGKISKNEIQIQYPDMWKLHGRDYVFLLNNKKDPPPPTYLINIYISGRGDLGKSVFAEYIAAKLYPDIPQEKRRLLIKDCSNPYQRYEGQPVAIWDEARPQKILKSKRLGRETFFNMINPRQEVGTGFDCKYGDRVTGIEYNIFTNPAEFPSGEFMEKLCGKIPGSLYEPDIPAEGIEQAWRRFQLCIDMYDDHWEIWTCTNWDISNVGDRRKVERRRLPDIKTHKSNGIYWTVGNIRQMCQGRNDVFEDIIDRLYGDTVMGYLKQIRQASSFKWGEDDIYKLVGLPRAASDADIDNKKETVAAVPEENVNVDIDNVNYSTDEVIDAIPPMTDEEIAEYEEWINSMPQEMPDIDYQVFPEDMGL